MVTSVDMNAEEYILTGLEQNIDYVVEVGCLVYFLILSLWRLSRKRL